MTARSVRIKEVPRTKSVRLPVYVCGSICPVMTHCLQCCPLRPVTPSFGYLVNHEMVTFPSSIDTFTGTPSLKFRLWGRS